MTLGNEAWIVSDFRKLSSGIAEDLAEERKPLMQAIQEQQKIVKLAQQPQEQQQAQADLVQTLGIEAQLDEKYYKQLYSLPEGSVMKRIPINADGNFDWKNDTLLADSEKQPDCLIFVRATRTDGRQYWALCPFNISKDKKLGLNISPKDFISTKTILRPDLPPSERE